MEQGNPSGSEHLTLPDVQGHAGSQPNHVHTSPAPQTESDPDRLPLLQKAYLLEQLTKEGIENKTAGELNRKITTAAKRELQLNGDLANRVRGELTDQGYVKATKVGRKISYGLTEEGRVFLASLEQPVLSSPSGRKLARSPLDDSSLSNELRDAQKAFLLLQLLDADNQSLSKGEANKLKQSTAIPLGLKPDVANFRREKLAEQNFIQIKRKGRVEEFILTSDGIDYLAAGARHLEHLPITIKGKTLNRLVEAARVLPFEREQAPHLTAHEAALPTKGELVEAVLVEFQDMMRERHGRSGLVPIHEIRQRIADRFGPATARHDVLDEIILDLWREKRLGLVAISDLTDATEQQINDGIEGTSGTLFYLEASHEQPVASESL